MSIEIIIAFTVGRIILSAAPGSGVLASVATAVSDGFKESILFLSGIVLCNIIFLLAALYGMAAIAKNIDELFFIIQTAGGIYLIMLGIKIINKKITINEVYKTERKNVYSAFLGGFFLTLGNPEPILFYASVVPTIFNFQKVQVSDALILSCIVMSLSFLITGSYCYIASLSRKHLIGNLIYEKINIISGLIMCAIGVYIILK